MALLPVDQALEKLLSGAEPKGTEMMPISQLRGRILATDLVSKRTHPPFNASAMDGYAVKFKDASDIGATLKVVGESAAGHGFHGTFEDGETVRIFTGAPVPPSADTILIQENTEKLEDGLVKVTSPAQANRHIRLAGVDFSKDDVLLEKFREMDYSAITLAASMNYAEIEVFRKPLISVLATGDELVSPGEEPGLDQIIASNAYGVMAMCESAGADVQDLGIAQDKLDVIKASVQKALDSETDILVTIGGASVGDHDLVQQALTEMGMELNFWKIAMRPGKPLMYGTLGKMRFIGLPGNPASSLVTGSLFLAPLVRKLAGRAITTPTTTAKLTVELAENDHRQEYMRAHIETDENGEKFVTPFKRQDSSLVRVFADANGLLIRPPNAKAASKGDVCDVILFEK